MFKLFCWFLDGPRGLFLVDIEASKVVGDLKNVIGKHDSDSLVLWKVGSF
jgi:hypothetical protein